MAIILAAATGVWTNSSTWTGGVIPGAGDVALANGKTVTINASVTVQEIRNDTTGSATAGGYFAPSNGITLTGNVYAGDLASNSNCFRLSGTASAVINGTVYGNGYGPGSVGISANTYGASNTSTGTLRIKATVQGSRGMPAVFGPFKYFSESSASAKVRATSGLTEVTLQSPLAVVPNPSDVKKGVVYNNGALTGTAVPTGSSMDMSNCFNNNNIVGNDETINPFL